MTRGEGEQTTLTAGDILEEEREKRITKLAEDLQNVLKFKQRRADSMASFLGELSGSLIETRASSMGIEVKSRIGENSLSVVLGSEMMQVKYGNESVGQTCVYIPNPVRNFFWKDDALVLIDSEDTAVGIRRGENKVDIVTGPRYVVEADLGI